MSENKGPASRRPRVVYVDDEPFVLNAFRRMVSISGFEPITFATPGEALAWRGRGFWDLRPTSRPDSLKPFRVVPKDDEDWCRGLHETKAKGDCSVAILAGISSSRTRIKQLTIGSEAGVTGARLRHLVLAGA
jgi:hypothetical protein